MHHHRRSSSNASVSSNFSLYDNSSIQRPFNVQTSPQQPSQHLSVQPPQMPTQKPSHTNTFVHKLYNMVIDNQYQHLIAWNYTGSSFIVCNIMEFSRDVLPKHFKHNNFSSFVRQLNMYGFHKVNKSPRGHRTLAENQIWEFSHQKFLRDRADLLDDIKRKSMESATDSGRRDTGDMNAHVTMMQVNQSDMMQQIGHLYENFNSVVKELADTKRKQEQQNQMMKSMIQYITQRNGGQLPLELQSINQYTTSRATEERPPSIFVTSHDPTSSNDGSNMLHDMYLVSRAPLSVQTQGLQQAPTLCSGNRSPLTLGPYGTPLPPSPSPSTMISDDELDASSPLYSPNSPYTPSHSRSHSSSSHYTNSLKPSSAHTPSRSESSSSNFSFSNPLDPLSH